MLKSKPSPEKPKILFKMTGSIACYKACFLISKLVQNNYEVQVVASAAALQFIGQTTLEGLTSRPVISDLWEPGQAMSHINLMRWADLILVAPATGNFINKIACGVGDDLLTTLFLAHDFKKPYLVAPAMNTAMYLHPATQASLRRLKEYGLQVLETASGVLACGESGFGKLLDPDLLFQEIHQALQLPTPESLDDVSPARTGFQPKKILVTSGGTQEPLDAVRVITNRSTGRTGAMIADCLLETGAEVTYLHARTAKQPAGDCRRVQFDTFAELHQQFRTLLETTEYDALIHAAAVSDYSLANGDAKGKMSSDAEELVLRFSKNPKLINLVHRYSKNKNIQVVAFKMTANPDPKAQAQAVEKLQHASGANLVIQNDMSEMDWSTGHHLYHWFLAGEPSSKSRTLSNTLELAANLAHFVQDPHLSQPQTPVRSQYDSCP